MENEKLLIDLWSVNMNEVDTSDCTDVEDILSAVISYLSELHTVDAVEVVRCKDCRHWIEGYGMQGVCHHFDDETDDDSFCSYGEKKEIMWKNADTNWERITNFNGIPLDGEERKDNV